MWEKVVSEAVLAKRAKKKLEKVQFAMIKFSDKVNLNKGFVLTYN